MTKETDALVAFHKSTGAPGRLTELNKPGAHTAYDPPRTFGNHYAPGTPSTPRTASPKDYSDGSVGRASDFADQPGTHDTPELLAIFQAMWAKHDQFNELIYAGPGVTHVVLAGQVIPISQVPAAIREAHRDHVHCAVKKSTFINPLEIIMAQPSAVAFCLTPEADGFWVLTSDGGVLTVGTKTFFGSVPGLKPQFRQGNHVFVDIQPRGKTNAAGYAVLTAAVEIYQFHPGMQDMLS